MFSCLQILEAFLWFVLITLLNVTLIILTLSVSRLLNLLRSEERFSRNAEADLVCRLLLEKKEKSAKQLFALKLMGWPRDTLPKELLGEVVRGGVDVTQA